MSNIFDMLEKIRELHQEIQSNESAKRECRSYIANNIAYFYKEVSTTQFIELINIYKDCFKNRESNIVDILKSKNIPYTLAYVDSKKEITREAIEELAKSSYRDDELVDSLEYIKLLHHKYDVDLRMHILKGDILRELGEYNGAIDAYKDAKSLKSLDFSANTRIITTYIKKYKKELIIIFSLAIILIIGQFILFNRGIISSRIYNFTVSINEGKHIIEDNDTIVIPLGETVNINIDYNIMPFYGYEGDVIYKIDDESIAKLDENNNLKGEIEGTTSLSIIRDNEVVYTYEIIVVKPKIERLVLSMNEELQKVGDSGKLDVGVIRNYDFDTENKISYKSTDKRVVTVDDNGIVEVVGAGKASIVVTCEGVTAEEEFLISLIVEELIVDYDIDLEVGEEHKLNVEVVTNSDSNNKPKVMFSLEREDDSSESIISMDGNGNIKALREGTQIVKVSCGNLEKSIIVTVNPKDITKIKVENLSSKFQIVDEYLNIDLTWNSLELSDSYEYDIYTKFKGEDVFSIIGTIDGRNTGYSIKYDLSDYDGDGNIEIYVVGRNDKGESKKSNTVNIKFTYDNPNNKERTSI